MSSGGKSGQVAGYRYFMGIHFGLCHGPVDELVEVRGGDLTIWNGSQATSGPVTLNKPSIYGGDKSEGGVSGTLDVMMGEAAQTSNSYLTLMQGALQSAYRGICTLVFRGGMIGSNNPYPKPWSFRVRRSALGWDGGSTWYGAKATINMTGAGTQFTVSHATTLDMPNNTLLTFGGGGASGYSIGDTPLGSTVINVIVMNGTLTNGMSVSAADGAIPGGSTISGLTGSAIKAMNPAHIVYEALTNRNWGMGYGAGIIDDAAFRAAADVLYTEGFGLCLLWQRTDSIESFIQQVVDHCGAVLVQSRTTGLFQLNLIRGGYDPSTLPTFGPDNVIEMLSYEAPSITGATNEMVVTWFDPTVKSKQTTTVQHLGAIQSQGVVVSAAKEYAGISTADLAARVAQRDLRATAVPLKRLRIKLDRTAYQLLPGGLFVLTFPAYAIGSEVFRIGDVDYGTLEDGSITITGLQDVFELPTTAFIAPPASGWTVPDGAARAPASAVPMDISYRDLVRNLTPQELSTVQALGGYAGLIAAKPTGMSLGFEFWTRVGAAAFKRYGSGFFCPTGTLQSAVQPFDTSIVILNGVDLESVPTLPIAALIDNEIVSVTALDPSTGIATIARGCVDSVPAAHSAGARIWLYDNFLASDQVEYFHSEAVDIQPLTFAPSGTLSASIAATFTANIVNRQNLPYPPAYLTINGTRWDLATSVSSKTLAIAWRERNRLTQMDKLVDQTQATVTPETGTTYSAQLVNLSTGVTVASTSGLTATAWTISPTQDDNYRLDVWSMRGGLASLQKQSATFTFGGGDYLRVTESADARVTEFGDMRNVIIPAPPPPPPAPPPSPTPPTMTSYQAQDAAAARAGNKQVVFFRWAGGGAGWDSGGVSFMLTVKRRTASGTTVWTIPAQTTSMSAAPQSYDQVSNNLAMGGAVTGSAYDGGVNYFASSLGITADIQAYQRFSGSPPSDWCEGFGTVDPLLNFCLVLPLGLWTYLNSLPSAPLSLTPPNALDWIEFYAYTSPNLGASSTDPASYFTASTSFAAFMGRNFVDKVVTARAQISVVIPHGTVLPGQVWTITLSSTGYTYTSQPGDFLVQVCNGLAAAITAGGVYAAATIQVGPDWRVQITGAAGTGFSISTSVV